MRKNFMFTYNIEDVKVNVYHSDFKEKSSLINNEFYNGIVEAIAEYKNALKINKLDPGIYILIANVMYMNNEIERSIYSYRAAVNMRPENDEYKLVFIQVLEDFIKDYRKDDIVAAF